MHYYIDSYLFLNHIGCVRVLMVLRVLTEENTGVSCVIATSHKYGAFRLLLQTLQLGCQEPHIVQGEPQQAVWSFSEFKSKITIWRRPYPIFLTDTHQHCAINPLKPELNPICYLLALLAHHFLHISRIRVKSLTLRSLTLYIYGAPILDVSRSHTTTQHSR